MAEQQKTSDKNPSYGSHPYANIASYQSEEELNADADVWEDYEFQLGYNSNNAAINANLGVVDDGLRVQIEFSSPGSKYNGQLLSDPFVTTEGATQIVYIDDWHVTGLDVKWIGFYGQAESSNGNWETNYAPQNMMIFCSKMFLV